MSLRWGNVTREELYLHSIEALDKVTLRKVGCTKEMAFSCCLMLCLLSKTFA